MRIPLYQVDAFTDKPFSGNPAAVCILDAPRPVDWMQKVAMEMNLSETAFLMPQGQGFLLRWFTPRVEVDLCGHATLASAHVLWEAEYMEPGKEVVFQTRSGLLRVWKEADMIQMDFPATYASLTPEAMGLAKALGATPRYVGRTRYDLLVELASQEELEGLRPDFRAVAKLDARGIIVTSPSSNCNFDFASRFFAPAVGVDEDPVTGSAHCCLGPFWSERLGRGELVGYQCSCRGGVVRVRMAGDRVVLGGRAVTVLRGELVGA